MHQASLTAQNRRKDVFVDGMAQSITKKFFPIHTQQQLICHTFVQNEKYMWLNFFVSFALKEEAVRRHKYKEHIKAPFQFP